MSLFLINKIKKPRPAACGLSLPARDQACTPALEGRVLTTGPPGKSQERNITSWLSVIWKILPNHSEAPRMDLASIYVVLCLLFLTATLLPSLSLPFSYLFKIKRKKLQRQACSMKQMYILECSHEK